MAAFRPMLIIRGRERFFSTARKDEIDNSGVIYGALIGCGLIVDFLADTEGGFAHFEIRPFVSNNCGIEGIIGDNDGIITYLWMFQGFHHHEGWKNDERIF
jgi:hypothetical protein